MHKLTLLALCGSLRHASYNRCALQALKLLSGDTADINLHSLGNLPLFNPDTENDNIPSVEAFKSSLKEADGLIISSPEYAHGISGVMKNALDWLVSTEAFVNIPIMLINTSPRATHAQQMLTEVLVTMSGNIIEKSSVVMPLLGTNLDAAGIVSDVELSDLLNTGLAQFCLGIRRPVVD